MSKDKPVPILVFDVNETLLDITTLEPIFERVFGNRAVLRVWFAQLILYSQSMTLSGLYTPFGELAAGAFKMIASTRNLAVGADDIAELKARFSEMPAHPDVVPALTRLHDAGFRLMTLTNSASPACPTALELAGIDKFFERSFSVETVRKFKPAPETYRFVAEALGVDTSDLCLIACHLWDTIGAQAAGCRGALLCRPDNAMLPAQGVPVPDLTAPELGELTDQIVLRWSGDRGLSPLET